MKTALSTQSKIQMPPHATKPKRPMIMPSSNMLIGCFMFRIVHLLAFSLEELQPNADGTRR